jgi:hypothetical protein
MDDTNAAGGSVSLTLTQAELQLIRNALESMESIMGHEEADTLDQIQALLKKLGD